MTFTSARIAARALVTALTAGLVLVAAPAFAKTTLTVPTLRVMLNPAAAPGGTLPDAVKVHLESLTRSPLMLSGVTRTGALEFALGGPRDPGSMRELAARLRADRSVLWTELADRTIHAKSLRDAPGAGRKLMVRLIDGTDTEAVLPRLASIAGVPLTIERTLGAVQVIALAQTVAMPQLAKIAKAFENDPAVRYADPVHRVMPHRVPGDPLFAAQWSLFNVNAPSAWDLGTGSSAITVAVVDTGMLDHPELAGRLLPGFDFISDAESARDGNARDANPRDEGNWTNEGDCEGGGAQPSFFHGLFVAGLIGANADNGIGIAGLDWSAKILPVRVLGKCGGTFEDVLAGMLWAAGVPVDGAPPNPNPAKVINLSLGGFGSCAAAIQEAVDDALAQGSVVVASAGNESDDASNHAPGNCSGVINVGALSRIGERSSYSNFGPRVDISAPGGDVDPEGLIVSTHAEGATEPGAFGYDEAMGTSFAAPLVSGTVALMLARNPVLTAGQVISILQGSSSEFKPGSICNLGAHCGAGMLDAGSAVASTFPAVSNPPPGAVSVIEYYDRMLDHYHMTSDPAEMQWLDLYQSHRWQRTGHLFYAWADPLLAPAGAIPRNVCRFYAGPEQLIDSYYFTADPVECGYVITNNSAVWTLQSTAAFWIETPDFAGKCRAGTLSVYRFFNGRRDASQRHTIDLSVRRSLVNRAWVADGKGVNGVAMCSPI